jgi:cellulose synthase/poly-beta-1,6-N-acetylglucosamine synthase-like glycosyltransferase
MTTVAVWLFAGSAGLVLYAYVGYPVLLFALGKLRSTRTQAAAHQDPVEWPLVSVTVPVYNEERTIRDKLEEVLHYDYPRERLQILVISDASSDGTEAIVREFAARGVELLRQPARLGKTAAENAAVPLLRGEIVVNSDASIRVPPESLKQLVRALQDPAVGVASGRDVAMTQADSNRGESSYVGYEMWVRGLETRLDGIVGASGCLYAVRTNLQRILIPDAFSRDFAAPLVARQEGFRAVSVEPAVAFVPRITSVRREYRRKVRTMTRGLQTLFYKRALLNPLRYGWFAWMLFSHKVCRWLVPVAGVAALVALGLIAPQAPWARWLLVLTGAGAAAALMGFLWPERRPAPRIFALPAFLAAANVAAVHSWINATRGKLTPVWEPTRR